MLPKPPPGRTSGSVKPGPANPSKKRFSWEVHDKVDTLGETLVWENTCLGVFGWFIFCILSRFKFGFGAVKSDVFFVLCDKKHIYLKNIQYSMYSACVTWLKF